MREGESRLSMIIDLERQDEFTEYLEALLGKGPRAFEWKDKPHRLIYDLVILGRRFADEAEAYAEREAGASL